MQVYLFFVRVYISAKTNELCFRAVAEKAQQKKARVHIM